MYPQILRKSRFFRHRVLDSLVALRVNLQLAALAQQHPPVNAVELDSAIAVERIVVRPQSHLEDQMPPLANGFLARPLEYTSCGIGELLIVVGRRFFSDFSGICPAWGIF